MEAQALDQVFGLLHQLLEGLVGLLGQGVLEHFDLVELMAPDHAPLVSPVGTGLPAEAGGVGEQLMGQISFVQDLPPVEGGQGCLRRREHEMHPLVGGIGDLIDLVGELGELARSLAALVL